MHGQARIYNVASGVNTSHDAIAAGLGQLGWRVDVCEGAPALRFPRIDVSRLSIEFSPPGRKILQDLPLLAASLPQEVEC
jgi:2-polyprenyl-6-methoxyphenol hydroxylase-like FAD-dependent oxidoreductase